LPNSYLAGGSGLIMKFFIKYALPLILLASTNALYSKNTETVTLQLQWLDQFQFAGYYIAKEKGFYEDAGLSVNIKGFQIGDNPVEEVTSGRAQYAIGRTSLLVDKDQGKEIYLMAAIFQSTPLVLVSKKSSGINRIEDFKGKKVMLTGTEMLAGIFAMTTSKGVFAKDMNIVKSSNKLESLINDNVDIISAYTSNQVKVRHFSLFVFFPLLLLE